MRQVLKLLSVVQGKVSHSAKHALVAVPVAVGLTACGGGGDAGPTAPACQAPRIQLFGDSVQAAQGDRLQKFMDARFGAGRVAVENLGVPGSIADEMPTAKVAPGAIVVVNYGINDAWRVAHEVAFANSLKRTNAAVFETPSPPHDEYAFIVRNVATETGKPLIDVAAYMRSVPDWDQHVPDGTHPDAWMLDKIVAEKVGPEMAKIVAGRVCGG